MLTNWYMHFRISGELTRTITLSLGTDGQGIGIRHDGGGFGIKIILCERIKHGDGNPRTNRKDHAIFDYVPSFPRGPARF